MPTSLDDLVSMAMFARIVETRSFTDAAVALGVSKSIVSKRLALLEGRLGVRLLHRTTRSLSLTPDGAELYARCARILAAADEASATEHLDGSAPRGVLRVNSPITFSDFYLADAIAEFVRLHAAVHVELSVANPMVDLVSERVDVAIRIAPALESSSLVARRIATTPKVLCASPAYLASRGTPRTPDDLVAHSCLRFSQLPAEVEWNFRSGNTRYKPAVSGPVIADNSEALRRAAIAGAGIIVLPLYYAAPDLQASRLVRILTNFSLEPLTIFAVYAKGRFVPAKVRAFVDFLAARFRSPAWLEK